MKTLARSPKPIKISAPATVISQKEYDSLVETLEILSEQKVLYRIESAAKNIRKRKTLSHKEVFGHAPNGKI